MADPFSFDTPRFPEKLLGADRGENARIIVIRGAFLQLFLDDARVLELHRHWADSTGLAAALAPVVQLLEESASAAGCSGRWELLRNLADFGSGARLTLAAADSPVWDRLDRAYAPAVEAYAAAFKTPRPELGLEAVAFVRSLDLPWAWLAAEMTNHFYARTLAALYGTGYHYRIALVEDDGRLAALRGQVAALKTRAAGLDRTAFLDEISSLLAAADQSALPRGRVPRRYESLERSAEWFYRARVKQPADSIRALAKELAGGVPGFDKRRGEVRGAIEAAARLLALTSRTYDEPLPLGVIV